MDYVGKGTVVKYAIGLEGLPAGVPVSSIEARAVVYAKNQASVGKVDKVLGEDGFFRDGDTLYLYADTSTLATGQINIDLSVLYNDTTGGKSTKVEEILILETNVTVLTTEIPNGASAHSVEEE